MPFALHDWLLNNAMEIDLQRRQDPVSSSPESTPPDTATQSAPGTSEPPPASSEPPTSNPPTSPTRTPPPTSPPPTSSPESSTLPTVSETSPTPTPTDEGQSSSVSTRSSASIASTRSVVSSLSTAGSSPVITQVVTSFIGTNSAGHTVVTVSITSNYAVPTSAPAKSSQNVGAIVGGTVGGVGGLLILILLLWFIRRRTKRDKFEENMFEPDRNIDRPLDLVEGDDVNDPAVIARPYHLPPSQTRPEMGMAADARPLSMHSALSQGRPLSSDHHEPLSMPGPASGDSYYAPPNPGMTMPMPMPLSRDHLAHMQSRANSTADYHSQPTTTSEAMSDSGSSSARALKDREARRLHVANDDPGVVVHSDAGRVNDVDDDEPPREIPPTYESISGPSGAR